MHRFVAERFAALVATVVAVSIIIFLAVRFLPGSILDISEAAGVELDHSCGGVCACSTCHVIVREGLASCNEPTDDELDQLEEARGVTIESRLGCQCVPNGTCDVVIEIPGWNRNLVREESH